ncbi:MAG: substrate-binding domain-containing protein [Proteobacteria bacterium]|nr:substrate-binding domain-containing protein [Pseudomonadota bacterium]
MKLSLKFAAAFAILLSLALASGPASAAEIKLGGTGGDLGTMRMIAAAYMEKNPDTKVTVFPSLGSGGGIRAVIGGAIDLSISSRPPKDKVRKAGVQGFAYATTALVVATAGQQNLPDLTLTKLIDIYAKQKSTWPDGRPIRLVLRPLNDGGTKLVSKQVDGMAAAFKAADKPGATIGRSDQNAADALEKRPDAIGILSLSLIKGENRSLRSLPLGGVAPTVEELKAGRYPLTKPFYMITKTKMSNGAAAFIKFMKSPVGKAILRRTGHVVAG